jgi:hypothetical protein
MNEQEKKIAGGGPIPQATDEERMIVACAIGKRYGIQTIARRTGLMPASVSQILTRNKVYFDLALKEWRVRN